MTVHSLHDLNQYIRRVLALNFQQPVWIAAEIAQSGQSRGHYYFDLVQKGEGAELMAQAQAVLWAADYRRMYKLLGPTLDAVLCEGLDVKLCVRVDFHERYGLKLQITDVDPAFTLGQLSLQRRQSLETLHREGLLQRNRALPIPLAMQRIAVVSSEGAAGFQDFLVHLSQNPYGYAFDCQLFNAAVQGRNTESEVIAALELIAARAADFDCAVVIRGGGARLDLAAFDGLALCRSVATMPLPVFSGIGHDVDDTVLDHVAHTSLKTPTAVADFLLQHNLLFENKVLQLASQLQTASEYHLKIKGLEMERLENALRWGAREQMRSCRQNLDAMEQNLPLLANAVIQQYGRQLDQAELICAALHPDNVLRRGFSITTKNGKVLTSPSDVESGDVLETRLRDGVIRSKSL